jgi:hypothetical protein
MNSDITPKLRVGIIGVANIAKKNALAIQNSVSNCVISAVGKNGNSDNSMSAASLPMFVRAFYVYT